MPFPHRLRFFSATIVTTLALALNLTSCPPPTPEPLPEGDGNLRVLVTTGSPDPAKGQTALSADQILSLAVTIERLTVVGEVGVSNIEALSAPVTVDLVETSAISRLLADFAAGEGMYSGVNLVLSQVELTLSEDPARPIALNLPASGLYEVAFPFTVVPDSGGLLVVDFGGLGVFLADGGYVFEPAPGVSLRSEAADVRIEGLINALDRDAARFTLVADGDSYTVSFSGAAIYKAGDFMTPTGAAGDLENQMEVAVRGMLGVGDSVSPESIEILNLPGTGEDEQGDRITICHFHPGDPTMAYSITVGRTVLQLHLDHGDFAGSCEDGEQFTLVYQAGLGGAINGETTQLVAPGGSSSAVTAVAEDGFTFDGWSDGRLDNPRTDRALGADLTVTANFVEVYTLTYTAGEGGTISGPATQQVLGGADGSQVTAVRDPGFVFSEWSDGRTDNPRIDENVTADIEVSAVFAPTYTLSYTAGDGGFLDGPVSQMVVAGMGGVAVTAVPAPDFGFVGWSDGVTDNPRTDLDVSMNLSVSAVFGRNRTLMYSAGENGSIDGPSSQTVPAGLESMPVTAVGNPGWGFLRWSDSRTDNPRTESPVTGDVDVSATFSAAITLVYLADENGTISGAAEQVIGAGGDSAPVTAVADSGYVFLQWSDGRTDNPRIDQEVDAAFSVTAQFGEAVTLTYTAEEHGRISGEETQVIALGGDGDSVAAVADEGYVFAGWSDGRNDNPRIDQAVTEDLSVTAEFLELFTLLYSSDDNGSIVGDADQFIPAGLHGTSVTARADDGFGFVGWSDGRTDNPRIDTNVMADLSVVAGFAAGASLNYSAVENGTISGEVNQFLNSATVGTAVTAVPMEGYLFLEWSDGRTDNPRTDTNVSESIVVTARFFPDVEMLLVPGGTFTMGQSASADDAVFGEASELPRHEVTLDEYEIGRFEITNDEFAVFMNFENHPLRDRLLRISGQPWEGHNEAIYYDTGAEDLTRFYLYQFGEVSLGFDRSTSMVAPLIKEGLPEDTLYETGDFPVTEPTWFAAVLYCNWLSERAGYEPAYDTSTWEVDLTKNGYRLPTEAEWERAAAWDGEKHWTYGFTSDTLEGRDRANYYIGLSFIPPPDFGNTDFVNPLGIIQDTQSPYSSPVGWFNGVNISPNQNVQTVDSRSPIGAYDMSGNLAEWCHDWYAADFYGASPAENPKGPDMGDLRVVRGGAWGREVGRGRVRTAYRWFFDPSDGDGIVGFRLARTTGQTTMVDLRYTAGPNGALEGNTSQSVVVGEDGEPVTAVPDEEFGFFRWSDGVTDNPRTDHDVNRGVDVVAEFTARVTLTYLADERGRIEGPSSQAIGTGASGLPVTAVPDDGYVFEVWSDGNTDNPRMDTGVTSDIEVTAGFVAAVSLSYATGEHGQIEGESTQRVAIGGDGLPVTAVADSNYVFVAWSDGSTDNPRTDTGVTEDLVVTANFVRQFTLRYTAGPNGTLEGILEQEVILGEDGTSITAVANEGFSFLSWSDGSTDNPRIDTEVDSNVIVTANFAAAVDLAYSAGENGTVSGELVQRIEPGADGTAVTAVPDEGHLFLQWDDGRTDNPRTDTGVLADVNVTATFFQAIDMIAVPAGAFTMGRTDSGDDTRGGADELPRHEVALSEYEIGRFEITNAQYAVFMNYMLHPTRNLLRRIQGAVWAGHNEAIHFYDTADPQPLFLFHLGEVNVRYNSNTSQIEPSTKMGLPEGTVYNMANNPVTESTWYGAVLYCNWLSERSGLEPVYDTDTWEADFSKNGYRLPTEAEWERAAAWDGEKHWIYGFTSDTLTGRARCNYHDGTWDPPPDFDNTMFVNPLGIVQNSISPYTNPVGWFNGINVSPNGNVQTIDSKSPIGAYDMSGNMLEWCHDWYDESYYSVSPGTDPTGPEAGTRRVLRGGAWGRTLERERMRTAIRFKYAPTFSDGIVGFRIARSPH